MFMFEDEIRHIAESHLLHVLMRKPGILNISESVIGVWIKGYVHHRALGLCMCRHPAFEILEGTVDIHFPLPSLKILLEPSSFPFSC